MSGEATHPLHQSEDTILPHHHVHTSTQRVRSELQVGRASRVYSPCGFSFLLVLLAVCVHETILLQPPGGSPAAPPSPSCAAGAPRKRRVPLLPSNEFAKITEGIMMSHGCYLCLLLFSVILIEPSEAGCMDHFKKADWNRTTIHKLPENITVKIMNKPEDIVVCSLMKEEDCIDKTEETCFLRECFGGYKPPCNKTDKNISVPFYHFMCLTNIAKGLRDKTNETNGGSLKPTAEEVCKVYEKVCKRDSPNPETLQGESAEKKESILNIMIGVLIFTNFLWAVAFYITRRGFKGVMRFQT